MSEPLRVLQVVHNLDRGGIETLVMDWLRRIDRTKVTFDFVLTYGNSKNVAAYENEARALGARIFWAPVFSLRKPFRVVSWWNRRLSEHPEWSVVHAHDPTYAFMFLGLARAKGRMALAHSHTTRDSQGRDEVIRTILRRPLRHIVNVRLACSKPAKEWMFGRRLSASIVHNGVDLERFRFSKAARERCRSDLGLDDAIVIGHVGRFTAAKNHSRLLHVFAQVLEAEPAARLLLVGNGRLRAEIEKQIVSLGVERQVSLVGVRDDIPDLLSAMDVFLLPSSYEGLPVVVVEAQAAGLPCVISDVVTGEVALTDLVRSVSLDESDAVWADAVLAAASTERRYSRTDELRAAGYDSAQVAKEMQDLYLGLAKKARIKGVARRE